MGRRIAYLHIGLPGSGGGFVEAALTEHTETLTSLGVQHPTLAPDEMFRAAIEIRRDHKAWGYRRADVEGTWAEVCRRARKGRGTVLVSQELLGACTEDQAALLLDALAGFEVHVVVTARRADAERHELIELRTRWAQAIGSADRVHVLVVPAHTDPRSWIWQALGDLVGYDASRLPLPEPGLPPYLVRSLAHAAGQEHDDAPVSGEDQLWWTSALLSATLVEVARLRDQERDLAQRNAKLEKRRRKLKRRLAEVD